MKRSKFYIGLEGEITDMNTARAHAAEVVDKVIAKAMLPIPQICGTCDSREPESGYCLRWCRPVESVATCKHWKLADALL